MDSWTSVAGYSVQALARITPTCRTLGGRHIEQRQHRLPEIHRWQLLGGRLTPCKQASRAQHWQ
jgi:hypothetical protein